MRSTCIHFKPLIDVDSVSGEIVAILVGDQTFYVHGTLLSRSSGFFQDALKPEWRTDLSKLIDLADAKPEEFAKYSQWLYTQTVSIPDLNATGWSIPLCRLYVLGERIMDAKFQDCVLGNLIDLYTTKKKKISLEAIGTIYRGTLPSSPARRLMAEFCAVQIREGSDRPKSLKADSDGEFMLDLINAMAKYGRPMFKVADHPWNKDRQQYFMSEHQEDQAEKVEGVSEEAWNWGTHEVE